MGTLLGVIIGLIILTLLVAAHEFGHGVVARRNGVKVKEFGIGFPPKAWGKKVKSSILGKNVEYTVNWLPLGGFVRMQGEHDDAEKKGDYGAASYWAKTKILFAGVTVNWVIAAILLTILAWTGLPKMIPNQFSVPSDATYRPAEAVKVGFVGEDSPAKAAGISLNDELLSINDETIQSAEDLTNLTAKYKGEAVEIRYRNESGEQLKEVQLRGSEAEGKGYLGIAAGQNELLNATWSAPIVGVGLTAQLSVLTVTELGKMVGNLSTGLVDKFSSNEVTRQQGDDKIEKVNQSVGGPVSIVGIIFPKAREAGIDTLMLATAVISLGLAVMNVLPIPAFDGGRWTLMTIYRLRKKKLTKEREESIVGTSFMVLLLLFVLVTVSDIGKVINL